VHHEELCFGPRPQGESENSAIASTIDRGQWSEQVDLGACLVRQRLADSKVRFITRRCGIVGGQEAVVAVPIERFAEIRRAGHDVVVIERRARADIDRGHDRLEVLEALAFVGREVADGDDEADDGADHAEIDR
jgi:hypothetical protein